MKVYGWNALPGLNLGTRSELGYSPTHAGCSRHDIWNVVAPPLQLDLAVQELESASRQIYVRS